PVAYHHPLLPRVPLYTSQLWPDQSDPHNRASCMPDPVMRVRLMIGHEWSIASNSLLAERVRIQMSMNRYIIWMRGRNFGGGLRWFVVVLESPGVGRRESPRCHLPISIGQDRQRTRWRHQ